MFRQPPSPPTTQEEALARCHDVALSGRFTVSQAAHERIQAQGLSPADLRQILMTAERAVRTGSSWSVTGKTIDGVETDTAVTFDVDGVTVV